MTPSDLLVLVLGVAGALGLVPWEDEWEYLLFPIPWWLTVLRIAELAIGLISLSLVPLALWRRARLGGPLRPGELLLTVCAAPIVVDQVDLWLLRDLESIDDGYRYGYWLCHGAALSVGLAALAAVALTRRRLNGPAGLVLLTIAVAASFPWLREPAYFNNLPMHYSRPGHVEELVCVVRGALIWLVPTVIGVAAIRAVARRHFRTGVLEWMGLILAMCDAIVILPEHLYGSFLPGPAALILWDPHLVVIYFGGPVVAGILGLLAVRYGATRWDEWFALEGQAARSGD